MTFLSFLSELNDNSDTLDESLKQGQELMEYSKKYKQQSMDNITRLHTTNIAGINSIIESMDNRTPNVPANDNITDLEDKFNKDFSNYSTAHKLFVESSLTANKPPKDALPYIGKTVTVADGLYSYINDYGFTQKYSNDSWKKVDSTCPSKPIDIDKELYKKLKPGQDMGIGQPCGFAGKNIQNNKTKEYAWVDIKGQKHIYSADIWKRKIASCNTEAIELAPDKYDAIANGSAMTEIDKCMQLEVDSVIFSDLMKQNSELTDISTQMISQLKKGNINNKKDVERRDDLYKINDDKTYLIRIISWSLLFLTILIITTDAILTQTGSIWHMAGIAFVAVLFIIINFINVNAL